MDPLKPEEVPFALKLAMFNALTVEDPKQEQDEQEPESINCSQENQLPKRNSSTLGQMSTWRGEQASIHVLKEVMNLCKIIDAKGRRVNEDDDVRVIDFGMLFDLYDCVSNKLVGILLRARKHQLVSFEGEILYQRRDEHVPIYLLRPIREICQNIEAKIEEIELSMLQNSRLETSLKQYAQRNDRTTNPASNTANIDFECEEIENNSSSNRITQLENSEVKQKFQSNKIDTLDFNEKVERLNNVKGDHSINQNPALVASGSTRQQQKLQSNRTELFGRTLSFKEPAMLTKSENTIKNITSAEFKKSDTCLSQRGDKTVYSKSEPSLIPHVGSRTFGCSSNQQKQQGSCRGFGMFSNSKKEAPQSSGCSSDAVAPYTPNHIGQNVGLTNSHRSVFQSELLKVCKDYFGGTLNASQLEALSSAQISNLLKSDQNCRKSNIDASLSQQPDEIEFESMGLQKKELHRVCHNLLDNVTSKSKLENLTRTPSASYACELLQTSDNIKSNTSSIHKSSAGGSWQTRYHDNLPSTLNNIKSNTCSIDQAAASSSWQTRHDNMVRSLNNIKSNTSSIHQSPASSSWQPRHHENLTRTFSNMKSNTSSTFRASTSMPTTSKHLKYNTSSTYEASSSLASSKKIPFGGRAECEEIKSKKTPKTYSNSKRKTDTTAKRQTPGSVAKTTITTRSSLLPKSKGKVNKASPQQLTQLTSKSTKANQLRKDGRVTRKRYLSPSSRSPPLSKAKNPPAPSKLKKGNEAVNTNGIGSFPRGKVSLARTNRKVEKPSEMITKCKTPGKSSTNKAAPLNQFKRKLPVKRKEREILQKVERFSVVSDLKLEK